jgi:hypothetical protein
MASPITSIRVPCSTLKRVEPNVTPFVTADLGEESQLAVLSTILDHIVILVNVYVA